MLPFKNNYTRASEMLQWLLFFLAFFTPIHHQMVWIIIGNIVFFAGMAIFILAIFAFAQTSDNEIVQSSVYQYFKHPAYIGVFIMWTGAAIMSFSIIFFTVALVQLFISYKIAKLEEQFCQTNYGNKYDKYCKQVKIF